MTAKFPIIRSTLDYFDTFYHTSEVNNGTLKILFGRACTPFQKVKKVEDMQDLVKLSNLFLSLRAMIGRKSDKKGKIYRHILIESCIARVFLLTFWLIGRKAAARAAKQPNCLFLRREIMGLLRTLLFLKQELLT